jgi:carbonic anhydrase/acetyltransferase-like protein (isoleucine patch superfamily)
VIGGPVPGASTSDPSSKAAAGGSNPPTPLLSQPGEGDDDERDPVKTTIGSNVYMHASSQVHAGAVIRDSVLIEPHVTILANVTIGAHAKICAGVTVDRDVDEWTVVYGCGDVKRRRKKPAVNVNNEDDHSDIVEMLRLKAMEKEREGTVSIFKTAARASLAKKK